MKVSKIALAAYLSLSIGFTPLLSTATSLAIEPAEIAAQIRASQSAIDTKLNQITAINEAIKAIDSKGNTARIRGLYGMLATVGFFGASIGVSELEQKLEKSELEKIKHLEGKAVQIGQEAVQIFEKFRSGKYSGDYWHIDPKKRAAALKELDALASTLSQSELNDIAKIMSNPREYARKWNYFYQAIWSAPESKLTKALAHAQKRGKAVFALCSSLLAGAMGVMGYTAYQAIQVDNVNYELADLSPDVAAAAKALIEESRQYQGDEVKTWIEIQTLRSVELSAEVVTLESGLQDLRNLEAALNNAN